MESIRSLLSRSKIIKSTYESGRQKFSESYRRLPHGDAMDRYNELTTNRSEPGSYADSGLDEFNHGLSLVPHPDADNPVLTRHDVTDCRARFVADPFIIVANGVYNMFFEIKSIGGHVFIGHAFSDDGTEYEYNKIVLQPETAQHTYPHVFRLDGDWLMVPSPGSNIPGELRVYKAVDFPTEWDLWATPIASGVRLDPTPIYREGVWYLVYQETDTYNVVLKFSDTLLGNRWQDHPASPIFENDPEQVERSSIGWAEMVPSGRPLHIGETDHVFYRSHHDRAVYHYRITELDERTFCQERVGDTAVFDGFRRNSWNQRFMHTVNPVYPWRPGRNVVAVDGLAADRYEWSIGLATSAGTVER